MGLFRRIRPWAADSISLRAKMFPQDRTSLHGCPRSWRGAHQETALEHLRRTLNAHNGNTPSAKAPIVDQLSNNPTTGNRRIFTPKAALKKSITLLQRFSVPDLARPKVRAKPHSRHFRQKKSKLLEYPWVSLLERLCCWQRAKNRRCRSVQSQRKR